MLRHDAIPPAVTRLLLDLAPHPALSGFALGGGTSLALRFGHRISVDLDFFTPDPFQPDEIAASLGALKPEIIASARNSLTAVSGGVKLDFLRHAYPMLAPVEVIETIAILSLEDVAAMKLNAVSNRGSKKDFYDVAELLARFDLTTLLAFFSAKYPTSDPFAVIRSLAWFEDAEPEPDPIPLNGASWNSVKHIVSEAVSKL
jgi:predicted nucleotidyltransferase component of viral defense system